MALPLEEDTQELISLDLLLRGTTKGGTRDVKGRPLSGTMAWEYTAGT